MAPSALKTAWPQITNTTMMDYAMTEFVLQTRMARGIKENVLQIKKDLLACMLMM